MYIYILNKSTQRINLILYNLNIFYHTLWPSNMKANHLRTFNFFTLPKFGKYQLTTLLNYFTSDLWTYVSHITHLVWTGKPGTQRSYCGLAPSTVVFAFLLVQRWIPKIMRVGPTGRNTRLQTHNSAFLSSLSKGVCRHKRMLYDAVFL
jgi:hypothetical protein